MGGALAVSFASYFPQLVSSLVLIAPGGLKDSLAPEYRTMPLRYPKLFPKRYVRSSVSKLLNGARDRTKRETIMSKSKRKKPDVDWSAEVQGQDQLDVTGIVDWEIDNHRGFVFTITNALKHAPIINQYETWCNLGCHIKEKIVMGVENTKGVPNRLRGQKVLLLLGNKDPLVPAIEVRRKASLALGSVNVEIIEFDGGHAFPITQGKRVAETILTFWKPMAIESE